jgi:predicted phosphoribosyltransferase
MAQVIANELQGELDVELVHKVGHPSSPEFALASVNENGDIFLGGPTRYGISENEIKILAAKEINNLQKKRKQYTLFHKKIDPKNRVVIVVDDGIATGSTMLAAVRSLQSEKPARLIVATPVASPEAVKSILSEGAEVVSLQIPDSFLSVGDYFKDFSEVTDDEVIRILKNEGKLSHVTA